MLMFIELSAHKSTDVQGKRAQGFMLSRDIDCPQLVALTSQALSQVAYGAFLQCRSVLLESCYREENGVKRESMTPRDAADQ